MKLSSCEEDGSSTVVPHNASIFFHILDFNRRDGNQFNLVGFTVCLETRYVDTCESIILFLESLLKLIIFIEVVVHQGPIPALSHSCDICLVGEKVLCANLFNIFDQTSNSLIMFLLEKWREFALVLSLLPEPSIFLGGNPLMSIYG